MRQTTKLLLLLAPITLCNPLQPRDDTYDLSCSADTSDAAMTTWSQTIAWQNSMLDCLGQMDNSGWNGASCQPKLESDGTTLGPAFGFWKGETHNTDGQGCYDKCAPCLKEGIQKGLAVTTSCYYKDYIALGPGVKWTCEMGFNYGG